MNSKATATNINLVLYGTSNKLDGDGKVTGTEAKNTLVSTADVPSKAALPTKSLDL